MLDQALAVVLAANTRVGPFGVRRIIGIYALIVADKSDRETINLGDAGKDFAAITRAILHKLTIVSQSGKDLNGVIWALLIGRQKHVKIFDR